MRPSKFPWGDETELALRSLWSSGKTAAMVAAELQTFGYITRCSVIGKARRLGLESRASGVRQAPIKPKRQRPPKPQPRQKSQPFILRPFAKQRPSMPPLPLPVPPVTDVARVAFMDLEPHHCRWPINEPVTGFCGCDKVPGLSYCQTHAARAFAVRDRPVEAYKVKAFGLTSQKSTEEFLAEASA